MFASFFSCFGVSIAGDRQSAVTVSLTDLPVLCAHCVKHFGLGADDGSVDFEDFVVFAGDGHVGEFVAA